MQTANNLGRFLARGGSAVTSAFDAFRGALARLVRDWRVVAGVCAAVALTVLFLRRRVEDRCGRLASALEDLVGERRLPGETLLELVHRAAPSPDIEGLVWRVYDADFAGERAVEEEKAVLRLLRDVRRVRATAGP